jgi:glucose-1-phosphate thymidylyltransferase
MKGVVLAGGTGSRLDPLTRVTNKHLLPVYDRPMVYFSIQLLVGAGIDRILVVTGGDHADEFGRVLGNGRAFGVDHLEYAYQEHARGIADALFLARRFAGGEAICVVLADNVFEYSIHTVLDRFAAQRRGARIVLAEVGHPEHYGVPTFDGARLIRIDEKPRRPASRYAVTGCYLYDDRVFDIIGGLTPSGRGELEITDVNNAYVSAGELDYNVIEGYWADCGESFESYLRACMLVAERGANKPTPATELVR